MQRRTRNNIESVETILEYLKDLIGRKFISVKIKSKESKNFEDFEDLKNSYMFNLMYLTNYSLSEYIDLESALFFNRKNQRNSLELDEAPKIIYDKNIINYYKKAMSATDPYIQFLSFYHVLEYYYDESYFRYLVKDMRKKLIHPDFSYKSDKKLIELAKFSQNRLRQFGEDGQGNEFESLRYVLKEFVNISELRTKLEEIETNLSDYYEKNKVVFSEAPTLNFSDPDSFKLIAKRIYYTRNSLVHSKSGKKKNMYHPYLDENLLVNEIPLIKSISEMIIINSGNEL